MDKLITNRNAFQYGPIEYYSPYSSDKLKKYIDETNSMICDYDKNASIIQFQRIIGTDGADNGECVIRANNLGDMILLFDTIIRHYDVAEFLLCKIILIIF